MVTSTAVAYRQVRHSRKLHRHAWKYPFAIGQASINLVPVDGLGIVMAILVSLLGWVITRFAHRYLQGEAQQARFVTATLFTLSCVALLVTSQHLLVIVLAWSGTSVGLHRLLTFTQSAKPHAWWHTKILSQPFCRNLFVVSARFDLSRCR